MNKLDSSSVAYLKKIEEAAFLQSCSKPSITSYEVLTLKLFVLKHIFVFQNYFLVYSGKSR